MSDVSIFGLNVLKLLQEEGIAYISGNGDSICHRCGFREDLRMGACFECADFVNGKDHGDGIHELWDRDNPGNRWFIHWR